MISIESLAVFLAILYLLLAVKQNIFCWLAAILSATLYFSVMYSAGLYMEAYLQIFYVGMAVYGWSQWNSAEKPLLVRNHDVIRDRRHIAVQAASWPKSRNKM